MKKTARILCIAAIIVLLVGFIYDVAYFNVPFQDGVPANLIKQYRDQEKIVAAIYLIGKILLASGIGLWVAHFCKAALAKRH